MFLRSIWCPDNQTTSLDHFLWRSSGGPQSFLEFVTKYLDKKVSPDFNWLNRTSHWIGGGGVRPLNCLPTPVLLCVPRDGFGDIRVPLTPVRFLPPETVRCSLGIVIHTHPNSSPSICSGFIGSVSHFFNLHVSCNRSDPVYLVYRS